MKLYLHPTARLQACGITILRVLVGGVFVAHGAQKLFVQGIPTVGDSLADVAAQMRRARHRAQPPDSVCLPACVPILRLKDVNVVPMR